MWLRIFALSKPHYRITGLINLDIKIYFWIILYEDVSQFSTLIYCIATSPKKLIVCEKCKRYFYALEFPPVFSLKKTISQTTVTLFIYVVYIIRVVICGLYIIIMCSSSCNGLRIGLQKKYLSPDHWRSLTTDDVL